MKKEIIIVLILFISSIAIANKTVINQTEKTQQTEQSYKDNVSVQNSELYYKLLYENSKETNSKLLSLLTTSMTVVIAVILAIIGSSFFYNYRFNKKEYELLTKETTNKLEEVQKNLLNETRIEVQKISESNKKEIESYFVQISETYKTNYETFRDSVKSIIETYNNGTKESISRQEESIDSVNKKIGELEKKYKEDIKANSKQIMIDILGIKADFYYMKSWYSLALSNYVKQCHLCIETNQSYQLKYITSDIIRSIDKTIESKKTITSSNKKDIERLITALPDSVLDKKRTIQEKYEKIEIKDIDFKD